MEEARGRVLNHIFVLGGGAALCGRVGVRLVTDGHLHGKPQALLVNSPGRGHRSVSAAPSGVKMKKRPADGNDVSPDVRDRIPVLVVCRPDGNFISFRTDVDHGSAHVVAVVVEGLADQTQELQNSSPSDGK